MWKSHGNFHLGIPWGQKWPRFKSHLQNPQHCMALLHGKGPMVPRYGRLRFILRGKVSAGGWNNIIFGYVISLYLYISFKSHIYIYNIKSYHNLCI